MPVTSVFLVSQQKHLVCSKCLLPHFSCLLNYDNKALEKHYTEKNEDSWLSMFNYIPINDTHIHIHLYSITWTDAVIKLFVVHIAFCVILRGNPHIWGMAVFRSVTKEPKIASKSALGK